MGLFEHKRLFQISWMRKKAMGICSQQCRIRNQFA